MKNKTSRVNKMKLKKAIVASLAIFILQTCRLNRMKS